MQPVRHERPGSSNFPGRPISPFAANPQYTRPTLPSGPHMSSSDISGPGSSPAGTVFPSKPSIPSPFISASAGYTQQLRPDYLPAAPYQSSVPSRVSPTPGPPVFPPPVLPAMGGPTAVPSVSFRSQPQLPSVPMGTPTPPLGVQQIPVRGDLPSDSLLPSAKGSTLQSSFQGHWQTGSVAQISQSSPSYLGPQGNFAPPLTPTLTSQVQHPSSIPPIGGPQSLVEEFNSLTISSVPGAVHSGLDTMSLPRPLDADVKQTSSISTYSINCNPRYVKLTTTAIPNSQSLLSKWHLPLGAVIHPLAEAPNGDEVPVVNFGSAGIVRCRRCRTYINPYIAFVDGGRKWRCNICSLLNDVPGDYFCSLDSNGRRHDTDQRPELVKGSVEFVAPAEYMVRPPMPPTYFFLIDVSASTVRSGLLEIAAKTIKSCLDDISGFPRTQIGFITFDNSLHFYNMKSSLSQPQMMVVSDLDDIFLPLPDDLLVNLSESRSVVDAFLDSLPIMFQDNVTLESAFGPALKAAFMVMSQLGGKLLIFQATLPSLGVGRLKLRGDELSIYGTDKEHTLRIPEDPFYKQMAADLTKFQIAVNIYSFSDKYSDVASLGTLAKYTGGQIYYYPFFQTGVHNEKFRYELSRDLTRETAWEAVMRVRCGKGIRFTSYHGHFMLRSTDLLALPAVDCDKAFAMQLSLEETLLTTSTVYFQVALLYTSSSGERRIRVHTAAAPVVADLGEIYRQADTGAIVCLLSRLAIEKTLSQKLEDARHFVLLKIVNSLKEYRNLHAVQHRLSGRMIYPESLKFLPLYGLALCKSIPLRGGYSDAQLDERSAAGYNVMILPIPNLLLLLYPSLTRIDEYLIKGSDGVNDIIELPRLPLTTEYLDPRGLYIYNDGCRFIIWFGRMLSSDIIMNLLDGDLSGNIDISRVSLYEHDNKISKKLMKLLKKYRDNNPSYYQSCYLVRQGEQPREGLLLLSNLVEDQTGYSGYVDWILQIYRQVQGS